MTELLKYSNSDPADYLFIAPKVKSMADTPFLYPSWQVRTNYAERHETIQNRYGIVDWGKDFEFDLTPQDGFVIGKAYIKIERGELGQTGGTFARFVPNEGYMAIESITFKQGTETLQTRESFYSVIEHHLDFDERAQLYERERSFTDKSPAERTTLASSPQVLYVDLVAWWEHWSRMFIKPGIIGTPVRIRGRFRPLNEMVETDGTSVTCTISNVSLYVQQFELMSDEKALHLSKSLEPGGISFRTFDYQNQEHYLTAGEDSFKLKLDNFTLPSNAIYFFILDTDDLDTTLPNVGHRYDNYISISRAKITAGQVDVTRWTTDKELIYILNDKNLAYPGRRIYCISWSQDPANIQVASGHKTPARMNNPTLDIEFDSALGTDHICYIFSRTNQIIMQHGASLRKVFS
jgi:hypothetical protein